MKKVITIHLAGRLFQIEEDAYQKLEEALIRVRLQNAAQCDSYEAFFAEYFQNQIELGQKVVTFQMVYEVLREKGLLDGSKDAGFNSQTPYQRLYRNQNEKVIAGICSGLGAYWSIDPVLLRLLFIVLFLGFGFGILLYVIMWILIPKSK